MRTLLNRLADQKLAEHTKRFNSPSSIGKRKPRLVLVSPLADAIGDAQVRTYTMTKPKRKMFMSYLELAKRIL